MSRIEVDTRIESEGIERVRCESEERRREKEEGKEKVGSLEPRKVRSIRSRRRRRQSIEATDRLSGTLLRKREEKVKSRTLLFHSLRLPQILFLFQPSAPEIMSSQGLIEWGSGRMAVESEAVEALRAVDDRGAKEWSRSKGTEMQRNRESRSRGGEELYEWRMKLKNRDGPVRDRGR